MIGVRLDRGKHGKNEFFLLLKLFFSKEKLLMVRKFKYSLFRRHSMEFDLRSVLSQPDPFPDILGQDEAKYQLKSALLVGRHVLIVGAPGIGKTTLAKSVAKLLPDRALNDCEYHCDPKQPLCPSCVAKKHAKPAAAVKTRKVPGPERFVRVQGSPDLTVEDLIGDIDPTKALKYGATSQEAFTPGKVFRANQGVLFFDELNRCPEKIQNSLLQVLEEGRATVGSYAVDIPARFIFIGTMNPEEVAATERLSDVFLDRLDAIHMKYPETAEREVRIVREKGERLPVEMPDAVLLSLILFVRRLRDHKDVQRKPSVRVSLGLYERAQANALIKKRKQVTSQDVQDALVSVLSHRIELKPSVKYLQTTQEFIAEELKKFSKESSEIVGDLL